VTFYFLTYDVHVLRSELTQIVQANVGGVKSEGRNALLLKPHTPHPTPHTSHHTPHTSHLTPHSTHLTPHTTHHTPHTTHHTPHTTHHTPHTTHLTPHTSHLTPHPGMLCDSVMLSWTGGGAGNRDLQLMIICPSLVFHLTRHTSHLTHVFYQASLSRCPLKPSLVYLPI
jgi:hypothetical protein